MRLAFLTHEPFYPPSGGGSAEAVYLVEELTARGHEVEIFCPRLEDPEGVRRRFGVGLHEFTRWRMGRYAAFRNFKYLVYPFFLERMAVAAARTKPFDLILSQHAIAAAAAGRLRARLGAPVVMNFLDHLTGFMEAWPAYVAPRPLLRRLTAFELALPSRYGVEGVLTVSDTLADYFERAGYPRDRIRPIYYGFDSELFPLLDPAKQAEAPLVVMHGSFDQHHLREIAAVAVEEVARSRPEVVFKFVGQETKVLREFVARLARRAPAAKIRTTGFAPYREVSRQLEGAWLGMAPYEETSGAHCAFVAKIVEYLALGLPVVSTPLDSARRYFRDEPMVRFSEFTGASFARTILNWLDEPLERRADPGRAASERVRRRLDWRVISRNAVDFIEQAQRQSRGAAKP